MSQERVRLRPIREEDLPDYVKWLNDPQVTQFLGTDGGDCTLEGEREWFAKITAPDWPHHTWAIEAEGRHIGNCALHLDGGGQTAGFGIVIGDKTAWGKGCGTAALTEVLRIGFGELGLHRIHLQAFASNARATRCYQKCGFRQEGLHRKARLKRGEWRDIVSMAILRQEWEARQASPSAPTEEAGPAMRGADGATDRALRG